MTMTMTMMMMMMTKVRWWWWWWWWWLRSDDDDDDDDDDDYVVDQDIRSFLSPLHSVSLHWRALGTRDEQRTFRPFLAWCLYHGASRRMGAMGRSGANSIRPWLHARDLFPLCRALADAGCFGNGSNVDPMCKGHWQAQNLWMVGGVTQKKIVLISMQMMNILPCTYTNNSGGTGSMKATSSKPVALSSGLLCSKNDSMNLWQFGWQLKKCHPAAIRCCFMAIGDCTHVQKNPYVFYSSAILDA